MRSVDGEVLKCVDGEVGHREDDLVLIQAFGFGHDYMSAFHIAGAGHLSF